MTKQHRFTLPEAAKLYGLHRTTPHNHSTKGRNGGFLSVQHEMRRGKEVAVVDLVELIRFYGELPKQQGQDPATTQETTTSTMKQVENAVHLVRLEASLESEKLLREQITSERDRAIEQSEHWRKQFEKQNLLLTDERSKLEKERSEKDKIVSELSVIKSHPKRSWWKVWQ